MAPRRTVGRPSRDEGTRGPTGPSVGSRAYIGRYCRPQMLPAAEGSLPRHIHAAAPSDNTGSGVGRVRGSDGFEERRGDAVLAAGEQGGTFDVDGIELAVGPLVPGTGRDGGWVAVGVDGSTEVLLKLANLGLAPDRAVAGDDRRRQLGDQVEGVGPAGQIALDRERRHPEGAHAAGEQ